ncbi:MAG: M23 family metallopeptidase [Synergistaceae bacterium]|nr:M23 family metallopeptidase [Synergistaceae bacterium]MBQ3759319.1 M23 family metallopeptidase [Synergistaceae bacterium]MBQ6665869.1 M23 family metallopeptidase [Synergistaceae bacterium]
MATIVTPYNPWREQLAVGLLGPLIGDFISNMRQNEQNRKTNAFRGALQDAISSQGQGNISLAQPQEPEGYNSNPWANAFHQNSSPLTQFDNDTSQRTPTLQEIAQAADSLAASKRFSMLNPDTVQNIKNNMLQMAEADRLRGLQERYAGQFGATDDTAAQMKLLSQAVLEGAAPHQALAPFSEFARHMTMSPYQSASLKNALDIANINANNNREVANIDANSRRYVADRNAHANIYATDATTGLGYAQMAQARDDARIAAISKQISDLEARKEAIRQGASSPEELQAAIAPIDAEISQLRSYISQSGESQQDNPNWSIGEAFIGGANKGRITGGYLEQRPGHKHQGIDLPVEIGTPVTLRDIAGQGFYVSHLGNDKGGYGTYVDIEGSRGNHTVKYRFAHLSPGSVRFKVGDSLNVGDIIAHTGNSGGSTGPHLHIECWVDGKKVNPHTMLQDFPLESQTQTQQQTKAQQSKSTLNGSPYLISPEGNVISFEEFSDLAKRNNINEDTLFRQMEDKGWERDTRDNYSQQAPKLEPAPAPRKPITLPADGDLRPSYMRPSFNTAAPAKTPILQQMETQENSGTFSDFVSALNLSSGDISAIIHSIFSEQYPPLDSHYSASFSDWNVPQAYNPQPEAFPDNFSDKNSNNTTDRNTLIQRFLNHPAFPASFVGLDSSFFWPQVMDFPVRSYPYR